MIIIYRVSSVLNRDVKQFGKKFMFDRQEETCWNSDQVTNSIVAHIAHLYNTQPCVPVLTLHATCSICVLDHVQNMTDVCN